MKKPIENISDFKDWVESNTHDKKLLFEALKINQAAYYKWCVGNYIPDRIPVMVELIETGGLIGGNSFKNQNWGK